MIEQGTHQTLMELEGGKYRKMIESQQLQQMIEGGDETASTEQVIVEKEHQRQMGRRCLF